MTYKVKTSQNKYEAGSSTSSVTYEYTLTTDTLRVIETINNIWSNKSYAGFNGNNGLVGDYSIIYFPDNSFQEGNFDDWSTSIGRTVGQQNLRFAVCWSSSSTQVGRRYSYRWTGLNERFVASYNDIAEQPSSGSSLSTQKVNNYNPFTGNFEDVVISGVQNTPYGITFLESLLINNLVLLPHFTICTLTLTYDENDTISFSNVSYENLTWSQIKPEDKTSEGVFYETYKNLFNNRYEVISENENTKTIRFCTGVVIVPYYGKSSYTYDPINDEYTQDVIANVRYGNRNIFANLSSNSGEYPCNYNYANLMILNEQYITELESVIYTTQSGVVFSRNNNYSIEYDTFALSTPYTLGSDFSQITSTVTGWNYFSGYSNNTTYTGLFNTSDNGVPPFVVIPSCSWQTASGKVSFDFDGLTGTVNKYKQIADDPSTIMGYRPTYRQFTPFARFNAYTINDLWATVASFGLYVADSELTAQQAPLADKINGNNHVYCGYMSSSFITNGNMLQGSDIEDLPQTSIDDIIQNTPYVPVNPSGGSDDPDSDKQVDPNKVEGVSMPLQTGRSLGSGLGFITMYNLNSAQLQTLGSALWHSVADYDPSSIDPQTGSIVHNFYVQLGQEVTGTFDTSAILDYFVSLKQYPFSVGTLPITTAFGSEVYIGNGKVGIPIGSGVRVLTSSIGMLSAGSCLVRPVTPYNDFRDYYNATVTVYLPYCGTVELNPTEVINQTLSCFYAIDFYTGDCTAYLTVDSNPSYIIGVANGTIGVDIPLSATADAQLQARHLIDGAQTARIFGSMITAGSTAMDGNIAGLASSMLDIQSAGMQLDATQKSRSGVASGFMSGGAGGASFYAPDSAFVIIRRGTYRRPDNYPSTVAYPSTQSGRLSTFSGYTECINVDMTGITATSTEKAMIYDLLQSGVIV